MPPTDDDEDDGAVVVQLRRGDVRERNARQDQFEELPVRPVNPWDKPLGVPVCNHVGAFIDEQARTLTCRKCGVPLDPFRLIGKLAHGWQATIQSMQHWADERDRLANAVRELERLERNAKSRVRSARQRRNDEPAMEAAARAFYHGPLRRDWASFSPEYRAEAVRHIRAAVEAYLAFPGEPASVSSGPALDVATQLPT